MLHISACLAKDKRRLGVFNAPVYRGKGRTGARYVDAVQLRTDAPPSKWVLRGVAVLCSTD